MNLNSELPDNYKTQDDLQFEFEEYLRIYGYVPYNDKQYRFVGYVYIKINDELKHQVILENSINNNDRKFMTLYEVVTIFQGYRFSPFP